MFQDEKVLYFIIIIIIITYSFRLYELIAFNLSSLVKLDLNLFQKKLTKKGNNR